MNLSFPLQYGQGSPLPTAIITTPFLYKFVALAYGYSDAVNSITLEFGHRTYSPLHRQTYLCAVAPGGPVVGSHNSFPFPFQLLVDKNTIITIVENTCPPESYLFSINKSLIVL